MDIVFFGTPDFVVPVLKELYKVYGRGKDGIVAVVTQSPKEVGRKKFIERSAVDNWAYKHRIPVIYDLDKIPSANLAVVAAYGRIIPDSVIKKFDAGMLNIHPSLLPTFRGASPIQAQIATNTDPIGVSIIKMDSQMDHGPIVTQFKDQIAEVDTNETLRIRLFERASKVLIELLPIYLSGKVQPKEQDHSKATFTKIIDKNDGFVSGKIISDLLEKGESENPIDIGFIKDQQIPASVNNFLSFIKALTPWPGVWTNVKLTEDGEIKRLKILSAHREWTPSNTSYLVLDEVQLEGKNPVSWKQFTEGYKNLKLD